MCWNSQNHQDFFSVQSIIFISGNILPFVGKLFSKDKSAYSYLPDSVYKFPDNEKFLELLVKAGFSDTRQVKLTGGVASIYTGLKKSIQ